MKLEVVIPFSNWSKGDIIPDVPAGLARDLIRRNLCIEPKEIRSPIDRMLRRERTVTKKS
jgi:hypothetical protein